MPQMSPSAKTGTTLAFVLSALGLASIGVAQPRIPPPLTDAEWGKIVDAGKNPIPPEVCRELLRTFAMALKSPDGLSKISPVTQRSIGEFLANSSGQVDCGGNRLFAWTRNNNHDLAFITSVILVANEVVSVKFGRPVNLTNEFGLISAREPTRGRPEVGSKEARPEGPSG